MKNMNKKIENIYFGFFFLSLIIMSTIGIIRFTFMPQAKVLLDIDPNLFYWIKEGHMHAVRLLIAYPGYLLSIVMSITLDMGYTYYCCFVMLILSVFLYKISRLYCLDHCRNNFNMICVLTSVLVLSILMNGRINFAFLGFAMAIYNASMLYKNKEITRHKQMFLLLLSTLLSTVSSGTLVIIACFNCIIIILNIKNKRFCLNAYSIVKLLPLVIIIAVFIGKYIIQMINKNLVYFGGGFKGFINMMQHGMGRFFPVDNILFVLLVTVIGIGFLLINYIFILSVSKHEFFYLVVAINISLYGLIFGLSTGTLVIVPFVIITLGLMDKVITNKKVYINES